MKARPVIRAWRLGLIAGASAYGATIIASLPATCLDLAMDSASYGRVRVAEARGTLWTGRGRIELRDASNRHAVALDAHWRLRPAPHAPGRLLIDVESASGVRRITLTVSWRRAQMDKLDLTLPAAAVGIAVPQISPLQPIGEIHMEGVDLVIADGDVAAKGTVSWRDAGFALAAPWPLGSYEIAIDKGVQGAFATVRTLRGPLLVQGSVTKAVGAAPNWQLEAQVPPAYREQLAPVLGMIGVNRGGGTYSIMPR